MNQASQNITAALGEVPAGLERGELAVHTAIYKRLVTLLSVKSLVTLALTAVFAVMTMRDAVSQDFMTIYAVIIAFYFGTQSQKEHAAEGSGNG